MADLSQMIRWNANFVRGLAQSVLDRAKVIRSTLAPYTPETPLFGAGKTKAVKMTVKKAAKKSVSAKKRPAKAGARKSKKANA